MTAASGIARKRLRRGGKSHLKPKEGDWGASPDTERIEVAAGGAPVLSPDGEKFHTKSNTAGDFETMARGVGLKPLPGLAREADAKRAPRVKAL